MPETVCALAPLKVIEPVLCVNVPALEKLPPIERSVEGAVSMPLVIVRDPVVVAAYTPNVHAAEAPPFNVRAENGVEVAISVFCCVDVELKVTVPV